MAETDKFHDLPALSTQEMALHLQVAPHDIRYWVKSGLLSPSIKCAQGKGQYHLFSISDLRLACFIRRLDQAAIKPKQMKNILGEVRRVMDDPSALVTPMLVPFGTNFLILQRSITGKTMILDASRPGQYVFTIALETLEEEVSRILAQSK